MSRNPRLFSIILAACLVAAAGRESRAGFGVQLDFTDGGANSAYYDRITDAVVAAADAWSFYLDTLPETLQIEVNFTNEATLSAGSLSSLYRPDLTNATGVSTWEVSALAKLVRGIDVTPGADAVLNIGKDWMENVLYYNPNPGSPDPPPAGHVDSHYAFMHELGHMLGFASTLGTGGKPYAWQTTYDAFSQWTNGNYYFVGDAAKSVYGDPVPLTYNNFSHVGNGSWTGRPGDDLVNDVMNGVVSQSIHYELSAVDIAILADLGYSLTDAGRNLVYGSPPGAVPEPSSIIILAAGLVGVGAWRVGVSRRRA